MTEQELIGRLQELTGTYGIGDRAADRIEELVKERDLWKSRYEHHNHERLETLNLNAMQASKIGSLMNTVAKLTRAVEERDELGRKLNTARYGQPDFAWSIHEEAMADLRAKLAKAVEMLRNTLDKPRDAYQSYAGLCAEVMSEIRATLAELEGK